MGYSHREHPVNLVGKPQVIFLPKVKLKLPPSVQFLISNPLSSS